MISCNKSNQLQKENEVISKAKVSVPNFQKNYKTLNVKGNVKSIECINYQQFVPNSYLSNYFTKEDYKFDQRGNIVEETVYLLDEKFHYRYVYIFDQMDNCIQTQGYDEFGNSTFIKTKFLNEKGLIFKDEIIEPNEKANYVSIYDYKTISDSIVIYNMSYQKINDTTNYHYVDTYENDKLIKRIRSNDDDTPWVTVDKYKYDQQGNQIFHSDSNKVQLHIWKFEYDDNNNMTRWFTEINRSPKVRNEFIKSYDDFGNIIKEVNYKDNILNEQKSHTALYEYDKNGNWIKRTRFKLNGEKISILERKLEYY